MTRMATDYTKLDDLKTITSNDLNEIEKAARVLSIDECYKLLLVDKDELDEAQVKRIERVYARGRAKGIADAGDALFAQMKVRGGFAPAEAYLRQMADGFTEEKAAGGSSGFAFNVILGDEDK